MRMRHRLAHNPNMADSSSLRTSAVDAAAQGVRQLLKEEKRDESIAAALRHCQVLQRGIQHLLQTAEQHRSRDSNVGTREVVNVPTDLLCSCFSSSALVLTLCKEVEAGSSWLLEELSSHLSALFRTTFTLIKVSTELLDQLPLNCKTLETVVSSLRLLCAPALHFDPSLPVLVWKGVGRMVCRGKSVFSDEWSIRPIISDICIAMETKAMECVQCAPTDTEGGDRVATSNGGGSVYLKLLKLCRFLSSLLVKLVQEFRDNSADFSADLTDLLIHLYGSIPPSPHCVQVSSHIQAELESNILLVCEPVIAVLLDCSEFLKCLLSPQSDEREGSGFGHLMCLCVLLKNFPKLSEGLQDFIMEPVSSRESQSDSCLLLDACFTSTSQCSVELQLPVRVPGVMCNGQPQRAVSLSEHLLTHFCSFLACLPHRHFHTVEAFLFRQVFRETDILSSLLAVDALTFIARCEEHLANSYANLLAQVLLQRCPPLSSYAHWTLGLLLRRMVALLSPSHQALFTQAHPPSSSSQLSLWAHLNLATICKPLQTEVLQQLQAASKELITVQLQTGHPDKPSLHWALRCLHSSHSHLPSSHRHPSTITTITQTWDWLVKQDFHDQWGSVVLCDGIALMADYLSCLPPNTLLKVFNSLMITRGSPTAVCLAVSEFLVHCGGLKIPANVEVPILRTVVFLFQCLLSHSSWLVLHYTLLAFRHFAESTPYASAVEECIASDLNDVAVDFLQCSPYLTSRQPELRQASFWVQQLRQRGEREARWREGEREGRHSERNTDSYSQQHQDLVSSKMQLLLDTWHDLCTLTLTPDMHEQLCKLCTSIQSHITSSHHNSGNIN